MGHHFHAVVYIDHAEAIVFEFSATEATGHRIHSAERQATFITRRAHPVPVTVMTARPI